jgi:hypothetical protein
MRLSEQQAAFTLDLAKLIIFANEQGYNVVLKEVLRTPEQAKLYAEQGKGIKNSLHIQGLAADIALFKDSIYLTSTESYKPLGDYWEDLNPQNRWGGYFTQHGGSIDDGNHFERKPE